MCITFFHIPDPAENSEFKLIIAMNRFVPPPPIKKHGLLIDYLDVFFSALYQNENLVTGEVKENISSKLIFFFILKLNLVKNKLPYLTL